MTNHPDFTALSTVDLTRQFAEKYADELAAMADQIPGVEYSAGDILAEEKGERKMLGKWIHSLAVIDQGAPVGFVVGYERATEGNDQYPESTIYISELAVKDTHQKQGIARQLLKAFFLKNNVLGMQHYDTGLNYSIQTNSADWNRHVIELYKSFGFKKRATKDYPNRIDLILGAKPGDILL